MNIWYSRNQTRKEANRGDEPKYRSNADTARPFGDAATTDAGGVADPGTVRP